MILQAFPYFPILGKLAYFGICQQVFPLKSCKIGCKTPFLFYYFTTHLTTYFFHLFLNIFKSYMSIGVRRHADIRVPHNLLQRLWVHARLCHIGAKGMTADMGRHLWHIIFVQIQKAHFPVYHGFCLWLFAVLNDFSKTLFHLVCHRHNCKLSCKYARTCFRWTSVFLFRIERNIVYQRCLLLLIGCSGNFYPYSFHKTDVRHNRSKGCLF